MLLKEFDLNMDSIRPVINEVFEDFIRNKLLDRALIFGKDFKASPDKMKSVAWEIFDKKLERNDFAKAAQIAKTFGLPKGEVRGKARKLFQVLESKRKTQAMELLRAEFKLEKKGLFSKFFSK